MLSHNELLLEQTPDSSTDEELQTIQCVSWDFELENGIGDWSPVGCTPAGMTNGRVSCDCYHATNFAILLVRVFRS